MGTTCQQFKVRTRRVVESAIGKVKVQVAPFNWPKLVYSHLTCGSPLYH